MTVMTVEAREMSIGGHRPLVGCLLVVVVVGDKRRSEELIRWLVGAAVRCRFAKLQSFCCRVGREVGGTGRAAQGSGCPRPLT